jgi:hypothetical protein
VEYGSLIQRLEEQDAEAEQMEEKLTHMAREVDSSRLNAGEYLWPVFRILDVYPESWFLPIPDPKTATKERVEKKIWCHTFFEATNFTKCKIIYFWNAEEKKCGPNFKEL